MVRDNADNRLIVEGPDDKHTILQLMRYYSIDWDLPHPHAPFLAESGGVEKLLESLAVSVMARYRRRGIVIDANRDPMERWAQLKRYLERVKVALPQTLVADGTIVDSPVPGSRVGVWLMPDNCRAGTLEDFLIDLVPKGDALWPYAREVTNEAHSRDGRFPDSAFNKAYLHSWLAWQENPGRPFGLGLKARYFRSDSQSACAFASWFRRLFFDEPS